MSEDSKTNELGKHYHFDFAGLRLDPYRILSVYKHIVDPEHQHAVKKLLRCGQSKAKGLDQDIQEVILTLQCWQRRRQEDQQHQKGTQNDRYTEGRPVEYTPSNPLSASKEDSNCG